MTNTIKVFAEELAGTENLLKRFSEQAKKHSLSNK
jgi:hypothetical protein